MVRDTPRELVSDCSNMQTFLGVPGPVIFEPVFWLCQTKNMVYIIYLYYLSQKGRWPQWLTGKAPKAKNKPFGSVVGFNPRPGSL